VYIYVSFDVEDLVHPDSDDVPRDIGDMLADDGIIGSMCVVGEKARLWERRGRADVIASVGRHDVILHTAHHSIHPVVAEYLADKGWVDGVAEAIRQENPGVRNISRIFGIAPSSWATCGTSWGPQIPAATRRLNVPSNIYSRARSGESGACWFAGQLCFSDTVTVPGGEDTFYDDAAFEAVLPKLLQQIGTIRRNGTSCLGLLAAHPTRLRYTEFWDDVNFINGQNPAPSEYRFAPRRSDEEYSVALCNLRRMILAVRDLPGVQIVPVRDLNARFPSCPGSVTWTELRQMAQFTVENETIRTDNTLASPAQTLDVLGRALLRATKGGKTDLELPLSTVLGPVDLPPMLETPVTLTFDALLAMCRELASHIDASGHLPTSVMADHVAVGPGPLLRALAVAFLEWDRDRTPTSVTLQPGAEEPAAGERLAEWGVYLQIPLWESHPPDLRLDQLALHTRLQSWSLKPAVLE
jgi:hypothetical protein